MAEPPSLMACERKLAWAYRHLEFLEPELAAPSDYSHAISFAQHFDPNARTIEVTFQGVPDLPAEWALIVADFLQNVRAALNYLAWELSRWNLLCQGKARDPRNATQFPIFYRKAGEWSAKSIPDLHPDHVAIIRELQPSAIELEIPPDYREIFEMTGLPKRFVAEQKRAIESHPLALLVKLTNEDKHRRLPVAVLGAWEGKLGAPRPVNCTFGKMAWGRGSPYLENDAVWGTIYEVTPTGEGQPEVQMEDKITVAQASIGGLQISNFPVIGACVEDIIARFKPVFGE